MNKAERSIHRSLNPRSPAKLRLIIEDDNARRRRRQQENAWHFLTTGKSVLPSPYGGDWNREYNPYPYPDAKPMDPDFYMGTGVGLLYRIEGGEHLSWQLAGWNLVRTHSEQRARRR